MKKYYLLIITGLYFSSLCNAQHIQERLQTKPTYSSINRDAYVGIWEYATSTDTLRIEFQKCTAEFYRSFSEGLCGGYIYKKNGLTVEDNITTINVEDPIIWGSNVVRYRPDLMDPNELKIGFSDTPKRKYLEGFLPSFPRTLKQPV